MRARPGRMRYRVVAAGCFLACLSYIHRVGFAHVTNIKAELGLTDNQWGWVMFSFLIAYAAFEVPWGLLVDRVGARHVLAVVVLGWSGMTAALAFLGGPAQSLLSAAGAFTLLLVLRFIFGAFQAGAFPTLSRLLADWMPTEERGTAQGLIWMSARTAGFIAPFLILGLLSVFARWQAAIVVLSLLGLVWCAAFWPWLRNRPEEFRGIDTAELELIAAGRAPRAGHGALPWRRFFRSRNVWALCFLYGFAGPGSTFFITLLPDYLQKHRGVSAGEKAWLTGLPLAAGVVACLGGGLLSDWIIRRTGNRKWGRRLNGVFGYTLAGCFILPTNWVEGVWALGALLTAAFFFYDLAMGPAWACCADVGERYAGTLGGAMNTVGNLGAAAGARVAGYLFGKELAVPFLERSFLGNDLIFVVFAVSFWLGAVAWLFVDVTKPLTALDATSRNPA